MASNKIPLLNDKTPLLTLGEYSGLDIIDSAHSKTHEGRHYYCRGPIVLSTSTGRWIGITTQDTTASYHIKFELYARTGGEHTFEFFEGSSFTGGQALVNYNFNRRFSMSSALTCAWSATAVTTGTCIFQQYITNPFLNAVPINQAKRSCYEFVLGRNTKYLLLLQKHLIAQENHAVFILNYYVEG